MAILNPLRTIWMLAISWHLPLHLVFQYGALGMAIIWMAGGSFRHIDQRRRAGLVPVLLFLLFAPSVEKALSKTDLMEVPPSFVKKSPNVE